MKLVHADPRFAVVDDLLPSDEFQAFWAMYRKSEFKSVHAQRLRPGFRASDGNPFIGDYVVWSVSSIQSLLPPGVDPTTLPARFCPTGKPFDTLIDRVRQEVLPDRAELIGREGQDWVGILGRLYAYPVGSSITWHSDHLEVTGSFIYYTNPTWDAQWGGELFVADESTRNQMTGDYTTLRFDARHETEVLMRNGMGDYVMPKPNRLVLLAPGIPHKVAKVAAAAGDQMRASFAGFFITQAGVGSLLEQLRPK